jgi:chemotaxis protein methyltransferase CheR
MRSSLTVRFAFVRVVYLGPKRGIEAHMMLHGVHVEDEVKVLLDAVYDRYGYDYRNYSRSHIIRRITIHAGMNGYGSIAELQAKVIAEPGRFRNLLKDLSISVTEMFRDPALYAALREQVVPQLRTWSHIRIWHAGCATGEEVYSMAILLKEEGLYDRTRIYATDVDRQALARAHEGIYPLADMVHHGRNYERSGGQGALTDHYTSGYGAAIMAHSLKKNIVWAEHNLVTDSDFAEVQMVICRNVLIYFDQMLQERVHRLFHRSLVNGGILCLGSRESLEHGPMRNAYTALDRRNRIYRRNYTDEQLV